MRDSILEVHSINTFYGMSQILFDVSLGVSKGEIVGLLGRNGSGKSTTMRSIAGLVAPRRGTITYKEHRVTGKKAYRLVRQGIAYVPDVRLVFADLTVEDNLEIAFRRNGTWTKDRVYQVFQSLAAIKSRRAGSLSSGEQQTLAIGRALMNSPELLLLDEPTEGLSPLEVRDREVQILKLREAGLTILLAEQNVKPALNLISRAYVINNGRIRFEGNVADLKANKEVMRKYLMV